MSKTNSIEGRNVGTTTLEDALKTATMLAGQGYTSTAGRLYHSPRRWSWSVRCVTGVATETFDDGSVFMPVATCPAARAAY